jgi:hypothetical protein
VAEPASHAAHACSCVGRPSQDPPSPQPLSGGTQTSSPSSRSFGSSASPKRKSEREQGHATREERFPLPPLPVMHAKPQSWSRTPVACTRQTRTACMKPKPPWPRNRLTPPDTANRLWYLIFGISNKNHAASNRPSTSQGSISTLRAFRLPSHRLPCHGRARSIKLHPVPCLSPFQSFHHRPSGTTAHATSQGGKGRKGEAVRENWDRGGAPSELVGGEGGAARFLLHHGTARHGHRLTPHQLALHRYPSAIATYGELTISPRSPPVVLGIEPSRLLVPWII